MSAPAVAEPRVATLAPAHAAWRLAAGLIALAMAIQMKFGMMADVAWLIDCDERWLAGGVPYRDFLEINPPASLLLYLPAVALAKALGLRSELVVSAFGFASAAAAVGLSALILRRGPRLGVGVGLAAIVALTILPGEAFCERDHLAGIFGLPLLAAALARAGRAPPPLLLALLAGLGAGAMAAIKPPYALIGLLIAGYVTIRIGWRAALRAPEYYVAAAVGVAYLAAIGPFFPEYVSNVLPLGVDVYVPARESLAALLASPGALLMLLILATAALAAGDRAASPSFVVAALATIGAAIAYVAQGKGWVYQAVPGLMFAALAGGVAVAEARERWPALGLGAAAAALALSASHSLGPALAGGLVVALIVETARTRSVTLSADRIGAAAFAAALGAACGVCVMERPLTPDLERALVGLGPHLKLGVISEDMGLGFPLSRRIGAVWAMRANSLYVNAAVERLLAQRPGDAALRRRIEPYAARERTEFIADVIANRPDALLVGPIHTRLHDQIWSDPRLIVPMTLYRRAAVEERPGYTAELWVRKDFAPVKP